MTILFAASGPFYGFRIVMPQQGQIAATAHFHVTNTPIQALIMTAVATHPIALR